MPDGLAPSSTRTDSRDFLGRPEAPQWAIGIRACPRWWNRRDRRSSRVAPSRLARPSTVKGFVGVSRSRHEDLFHGPRNRPSDAARREVGGPPPPPTKQGGPPLPAGGRGPAHR